MKFHRGLNKIELARWHSVVIGDLGRQYDMYTFLEDYESKGEFSIETFNRRKWWFELAADALIFRLKFGQ